MFMRKSENTKNATVGCGMTWHNKLQSIDAYSKKEMKGKRK